MNYTLAITLTYAMHAMGESKAKAPIYYESFKAKNTDIIISNKFKFLLHSQKFVHKASFYTEIL